MSQVRVFILATCRSADLLPYTTLVFRTIRVGFPNAEIHVDGNALPDYAEVQVRKACDAPVCLFVNQMPTTHHKWIDALVHYSQEPFWILDCDLILFDKIEDWKFDTALAGFRTPEFLDEFTNAVTKPRLHTSLLYVDPVKVREAIAKYEAQFPDTIFNPKANLFYPLCLPNEGHGMFYDTAALLYQAIGGTEFTDAQKDSYSHLHFGTISDLVLPRLKNGVVMAKVRDAILEKPELARGMWRDQEAYYNDRQVVREGKNVIAPVLPEDSALARKWNEELCCGNQAAMQFNDLWYFFIHAADDLIDTMQDGRPTLSKQQIIGIFFHACILYNSPFYVANRELLYPLILDITSEYIVSVEWERSPKAHLRTMADIFRMAASRMYYMVALLCGGQDHALRMIKQIHEQDFLKQHSPDGRPI